MRNRLLYALLLTLTGVGCSSDYIFEDQVDVREHKWPVTNVPEFTFNIEDTLNLFDVNVNLRYTNLYQYQNIYMTYILEGPEGQKIDSTLTNLQLFEAKTGRPLGDGLGDIFQREFTVLTDYQFQEKGQYRIRLRQTMRPDTLREVVSVGVNIGPAGSTSD